MKIQLKKTSSGEHVAPRLNDTWKILLVDDEPDVIKITKLNLKKFHYLQRRLEFIEAHSAAEAKEKLGGHSDIAVALIDVVMETDDAGLKLIDYIRNDLNNKLIRLVIRTGQPGLFDEKMVIDKFDINDFKDKVELTPQKLYTMLRFSLKDYHSILTMENSKLSLQHIIQVTPHLYSLKLDCLEPFFRWVLAQLVYVFRLGRQESLLDLVGHLATIEGNEVKLQASIGVFDLDRKNPDLLQDLFQKCKKIALDQSHVQALDYGSIVLPIKTTKQTLGFAHFQCAEGFRGGDLESVQILVNQLAASLENLMLHHNLENSYNQSIDMLATVAEFKDQTIGGHINRIQELTKLLSIALGLSDEEVDIYTKASRLHDIGKVGIPDAVLCKPSRLTHDEFRLISQHTMFGEKILEKSPSLHTARIVARSHHEKWSGDGYPDGLYGKEIPLVARIVSIVDVFDALASPRPYKNAWNIDDVVGEIEAASGSQFDPIVVATFLRIYNSGDLDNLINEYKQFSLPPLD